ncbi:hypothetical protein CHN51_12195 [Sphingorhabdus sp. YGSMI21]|nr:hypothetical protein CHN51_12195 [Sphingorhabdus sp. YGSMI21]
MRRHNQIEDILTGELVQHGFDRLPPGRLFPVLVRIVDDGRPGGIEQGLLALAQPFRDVGFQIAGRPDRGGLAQSLFDISLRRFGTVR